MDVVNGEYVPRKSILKSRSRENSVCSDTSESSAADVEDRRGLLRSTSSEEAVATEAGGSSLDELQENHPKKPLPSGVSEVCVCVSVAYLTGLLFTLQSSQLVFKF